MKAAENDGTERETDMQRAQASELSGTQYNDWPESTCSGSQTLLSPADPSEASQGNTPLSALFLPGNGGSGAVLARMEERFARGLTEILKAFQDKLAFDQFKEDQITRLHDEL